MVQLNLTDDTELEEGANRVGYPSLVVAHTDKRHAFKYAYEDQFGIIRLEKGSVQVEQPAFAIDKRWKKEADVIEKANKSKPVIHNNYLNQGSLFKRNGHMSYGYSGWGEDMAEERKYKEASEKMENATKLHDEGKMTDKK